MNRKASAVWQGSGKDGKGQLTTQSGVLSNNPYGFNTRFENEPGTNPEELIAAAHAGCFTMALAFQLQGAGFTADELRTESVVTLEKDGDGFTITAGTLVVGARFYPSIDGGFFLLGGLGIGRLDIKIDGFGSAGETGSGAILGLGWDIRVAPNVSLTPFWNGIGIKVTDGDANFGQIGIGLTIH